jgi:cyclohexanone monooxygenase
MASDASDEAPPGTVDCDALVVGAGFAGLYALHRLRELGLSTRVIERADDVGGTWYYNQYPGARCDSESHVYCYSFSEELREEWEYSERYPEQSEILDYLHFVADRLELRRDIRFGTAVESATFDEASGVWTVRTDDGGEWRTQHFVLAIGPLSDPYVPDFDGLEDFAGELYHTATWPHDPVDFGGEAVGVIGTGASGAQAIPRLADRADTLTVYQRTPNYIVPARNRPLSDEDWERIRANYDEIWERARNTTSGHPFEYEHDSIEGLSDAEIRAALEERWQQGGFRFFLTFGDLLSNEETNERVSEFIREKIRERVGDPDLAETLVPTDHPYGAKRPPLDYEGYYETFTRGDVDLVNVRESPIERFTADGIETADARYGHDSVVLATGFDAINGAFDNIDIRGRNGTTLAEKWDGRPRAYLGFGIDEFPNMFMISGPQNPSVITNQPVSIEQQVDWVADCIDYLRANDLGYVEADPSAVESWVEHSNAVADKTLYPEANSWYRGDNIPGKEQVFLPYPGGFNNYRDRCDEIAANGYEGFRLAETPAGLVEAGVEEVRH